MGMSMRGGLCRGLGYSTRDRAENLRRSAEWPGIALMSNLCVIAASSRPSKPTAAWWRRSSVPTGLSPGVIDASWKVPSRDVKGL